MTKLSLAICAGHGINTPGKRTPCGMREFEFNVVVAGLVADMLSRYKDVSTFFVHDHPNGRNDVSLQNRTNKANSKKADLYLSIHANAAGNGGWHSANGIETFIHPNAPQATLNIARKVQSEIIKATKRRDRGVKRANFHVLRETRMPAILVECGFMTNKEEAELLKSQAYRRTCATAIVKPLVEIYKLELKPQPAATPQPSDSNTLYRVQVGAFGNRQNAINRENELKRGGESTYVVKDNGLYKVQVGAFSNRQNAERKVNDVKRKFGFDAFITTRSGQPVNSNDFKQASRQIQVGSKVRVKQGARDYDRNVPLNSEVYRKVYDVIRIDGNRVVIGVGTAVTTAIHKNDLILQ